MTINLRIGRLGRFLAPGYGACLHCETPWKFVKEHDTSYSPQGGCFPLCEACWDELGTPEARMPYYDKLVDLWQELSPDQPYEEKRAMIRDAVGAGK